MRYLNKIITFFLVTVSNLYSLAQTIEHGPDTITAEELNEVVVFAGPPRLTDLNIGADKINLEVLAKQPTFLGERDNSTELLPSGAGLFKADLEGIPGKSYTLSVITDDGKYTAYSTMPMLFNAYSTGFISEKQSMGNSIQYKYGVEIETNQLSDEREYFVCWLFRNSEYYKWSVVDSRNADIDGKINLYLNCFSDNDDDDDKDRLNKGDSLYAVVASVDPEVYTYYYSIKTGSGNNSNPTVLFTPTDASQHPLLGYFSAQTVVKTSSVVFDYDNVIQK